MKINIFCEKNSWSNQNSNISTSPEHSEYPGKIICKKATTLK